MNKSILILSFAFFSMSAFAQQQLPNPGFEDWENLDASGNTKAESEPTHWSSLKTAEPAGLAAVAPEVMKRVEGRTGNWAILLEVVPAFGISANGMITNGRVHADYDPSKGYVYTNVNDPQWHTEFTNRPDSIVGWYKYEPKSGDKGKVEIILHQGSVGRLPMNQTTVDNMVGRSICYIETAQTEWTRFSAPFTYLNGNNPDYILVTIAAGDSTQSIAETKLWIDDLELIYNTSSIDKEEIDKINVFGQDGFLYFDLASDEKVVYSVVDISGKIIQFGNAKQKTVFPHQSGIYFIQVQTNKSTFVQKLYFH